MMPAALFTFGGAWRMGCEVVGATRRPPRPHSESHSEALSYMYSFYTSRLPYAHTCVCVYKLNETLPYGIQ